jgi:colanic acid/amylovoran biosynthesis glycosyltransferase
MPAAPRPHFAYIFERFPSFTQTFCAREVLELQRQGTRLLLFSIRDTRDEALQHFPPSLADQVITLPPSAVLVREVEALKEQRLLPQSLVLTLRHWGSRPDKARLYEAAWIGHKLRAAQVHHVHTHFAGLAARTAWWVRQTYGLSYSFTGHANDLFCPDDASDLKLPRLIADAAAIIAVSDYTAAWLRQHHPAAASRIHRVYNGLDLAPFLQPSPPPPASPPLLLSVGRLIEKKGFADLIDACALLRDRSLPFQCRIVGDGPLEADLQARIAAAQLQQHVALTGPLAQADIIDLLAQAALFVLPCVTESTGGRDVLPTVLMEAMAAALPCVSTTVAGVPEMVLPGQTGLLAPERDPAALAAALASLLTDPARARRLGQAGLALARSRFDQTITAAHLRHLLTAFGRVNGPPASLALAAAQARRLLRSGSRPLRFRPGKTAAFP